MNFTRICWTLSAFVICLSSTEGQTLPERVMNDTSVESGFEPVVSCDRDTSTSGKRIQVLWMTTGPIKKIYRAISHDLGASWGPAISFSNFPEARIDPFAACNIWTNPVTTRHMYFGWFSYGTGDHFRRSVSGTEVDNPALMGGGDRP